MAFPTVTPRHSHVTANATSITILLPDGSNTSGKLVIVFVTCDGTTAMTFPAGWTAITNAAGNDGGSASRTEARYRIIDGTEGFDGVDDSISVSGGSEEWAATAYLISGHAASTSAPECQAATGSTGNADTPSLTPSWGALDSLWIVYAGLDASVSVTAFPTNYSDNQHQDNTVGTGGCTHATATRNLNATSDNPPAFANGSESWRALTVAVRPGNEGSTNNGTATITEAVDTVSSDSKLDIAGLLSITEAVDTISSTTTLEIVGGFNAAESGDTVSSGSTLEIVGTLSVTEIDDTLISVGQSSSEITGTLNVTETNDTVTGQSTLTISGVTNITETNDTFTSEGVLTISGLSVITESGDTLSGLATIDIVGTTVFTESNDTVLSDADLNIFATVTYTEASDTLQSESTFGDNIAGIANINEASDSIIATSELHISGILNSTEGNDSLTGTGIIVLTGTLNITESGDSIYAIGTSGSGLAVGIISILFDSVQPRILFASKKVNINFQAKKPQINFRKAVN
jgi:hypothetical protein